MKRTSSIAGFLLLAAFCMAGEDVFASRLWPLKMGQTYTYQRSDALNDPWTVTVTVEGCTTDNSNNYFHLEAYNYENSGEYEDWDCVRSSEDVVYYKPGEDIVAFQKGEVGTKWHVYDEYWQGYQVTEIVAIEPISVPYGSFPESYKFRNYICENFDDDPDDPIGWVEPFWYEWVVPGVGFVKQDDYWTDAPPAIMELVSITQNSDLTGDDFVGLEDFAVIARWWLDDECNVSNNFCEGADFDLSGQVTLADLLAVVQEWLVGERIELPNITWVYVDDDGSGMKDAAGNPIIHDGFTGTMSKYQTTHAQFALYLNAAMASDDIRVEGNYVKGNSAPYSDQNYYQLDGPGLSWNGALNGGKARIIYNDGIFTVESGFENYPVTYVSWYGATAFATYYGWRLPTEWEWQAVADYDGSYVYGCGTTIDNSMANYFNSVHPYGTTPVGDFGEYGYGMADMAGNVLEWTSSVSGSSRILRGGGWYDSSDRCTVSFRNSLSPINLSINIGFRVCQ